MTRKTAKKATKNAVKTGKTNKPARPWDKIGWQKYKTLQCCQYPGNVLAVNF